MYIFNQPEISQGHKDLVTHVYIHFTSKLLLIITNRLQVLAVLILLKFLLKTICIYIYIFHMLLVL